MLLSCKNFLLSPFFLYYVWLLLCSPETGRISPVSPSTGSRVQIWSKSMSSTHRHMPKAWPAFSSCPSIYSPTPKDFSYPSHQILKCGCKRASPFSNSHRAGNKRKKPGAFVHLHALKHESAKKQQTKKKGPYGFMCIHVKMQVKHNMYLLPWMSTEHLVTGCIRRVGKQQKQVQPDKLLPQCC